jgi:hypothetical protein
MHCYSFSVLFLTNLSLIFHVLSTTPSITLFKSIMILPSSLSLLTISLVSHTQTPASSKRPAPDGDVKAVKKQKSDNSSPSTVLHSPDSPSISPSCVPTSSISISQLLTPTNPFASPLTSYLLPDDGDADADEDSEVNSVVQTSSWNSVPAPSPSKPVQSRPASSSPSSTSSTPSKTPVSRIHHCSAQSPPFHSPADACCQEHGPRTSIAFINGPSPSQVEMYNINPMPYSLPKINILPELPPKVYSNEPIPSRNALYYEMSPYAAVATSHLSPYPTQSGHYGPHHSYQVAFSQPSPSMASRQSPTLQQTQPQQSQAQHLQQLQQQQQLQLQQQQQLQQQLLQHGTSFKWVMEYDKPRK